MTSEYSFYKIGDIGEVVGGGTPSTQHEEYFGGDIPWITPKDLSGYSNKYISRGDRNITDLGLKNSSTKLLPKNTVLLSSRAPIGYLAIAANPVTTNQGFKSIICNEKIVNPEYLYYLLSTKKDALEAVASGSTFKEVSGTTVKNFKVKIPDLRTQQKIIDILSPIDKKIELNESIIGNLEAISSVTFKHWFVDFEFPNEDGEPYKSSGGKMVESELGLIPDGWKINKISELANEVITGKTPSTKDKDNYGLDIPFIKIPDMHGKTFVYETESYLSKQGVNKGKVLPEKSICVSCIATPGLVSMNVYQSQTNQQINSIIPTEENRYFLFLNLRSKSNLIKELGSGGSATLNLNKTEFEKIKLIVPNSIELQKFNQIIDQLMKKLLNSQLENGSLQKIRDALLPKLLSGEIELPTEEEV